MQKIFFKKFTGYEIMLAITIFFFLLFIGLTLFKGIPKTLDLVCTDNCILDYWTIVHIFMGLLLGVVVMLTTHKKKVLFFGLLLIVLFELFEQVFLVSWGVLLSGQESSANVVSDILITFIAFLIGADIVKRIKK